MPSHEQVRSTDRARQLRAVQNTVHEDQESAFADAYDRGFERGKLAGALIARRVITEALKRVMPELD